MDAPLNRFKQKLLANEQQWGCWLAMANSYTAEIAATAGFDWLLIDGEHAPNGLRDIMAQLQVIEPSASSAVVRLPVGDSTLIKQMLDIGAQTLLIPMIESAAHAADLVRATRYPPEGYRGVGAALGRATGFNTVTNYLPTANAQICLLLQVESRAGLEALDDILAIDGVDGVFIGPADLAADMGHLGKPTHPEVVNATLDAITRTRAAGKGAGILTTDRPFLDACIDAGTTFTAHAIDVLLFTKAIRDAAKEYKGR